MAGNSVGYFYMHLDWVGAYEAILLVTDRGEWKLIRPELSPWFASGQNNHKGYFQGSGIVKCFGMGSEPPHLFTLTSLHFDAVNLGQSSEYFERRFLLGADWATVNPRNNALMQKAAEPARASHGHAGDWFAIITGPLLEAARERLAEAQKAFRDFCIDAGLTAVSFVDPTGISAVAMAERASERGDYLGCALALVAVLPVARQLAAAAKGAAIAAKMDKLLIEIQLLQRGLSWSTKAARTFNLDRELVGSETLRVELQTTTKPAIAYKAEASVATKAKAATAAEKVANAANKGLQDVSKRFTFRKFTQGKFECEEISGELGVPSKVVKHRLESEQRKVSAGTGEHAGHRIGIQFGAPGDVRNIGRQNPNMNTYAPHAVRDEFYCANGAGDYLKMENEWAAKLENGWKIQAKVCDKYRIGETRPAYRVVEWTETTPKGVTTSHTMTYGNFSSIQSRAAGGK